MMRYAAYFRRDAAAPPPPLMPFSPMITPPWLPLRCHATRDAVLPMLPFSMLTLHIDDYFAIAMLMLMLPPCLR